MESRTRVLKALQHVEPDRVPLDIWAAPNTGIHVNAHGSLLNLLADQSVVMVEDIVTQKAVLNDDVLESLGVDLRKVDLSHSLSQKYYERLRERPDYDKSSDDWGIT